jgi:hypothetical protein
MKTRNVVIVCVTALIIASFAYLLPAVERKWDRDLQRAILRSIPAPTPRPSFRPGLTDPASELFDINPGPEPALQRL